MTKFERLQNFKKKNQINYSQKRIRKEYYFVDKDKLLKSMSQIS